MRRYTCKINKSCVYQISENKRRFLQKMRELRNKVSYEGYQVTQQFISQNSKLIHVLIDELLKITEKEIEYQ